MNTKSIFENILLLDKRAILSFPSLKQFISFKAQLRVYKSRYNALAASLETDLESRSIQYNILPGLEGEYNVMVSLSNAQKNPSFTLLEVIE